MKMSCRWYLLLIFGIWFGVTVPAVEESKPEDLSLHMERAKVKLALKQPREAIKELVLARQIDPKNTDVYNLLGLAYLQSGRVESARTAFKRAIRLDDDNARAYNNLGAIYHVKAQYKSATKYYKQAIEKDPRFLLAYFNLGNAYFARKKFLQAIDALHKLVELDPDYLMKERSGLEIGVQDVNKAKQNFYYAKMYAQVKDTERMFYFLQKSFANGFKDIKELMEDKDFAPYQQDPRFQALVKQ